MHSHPPPTTPKLQTKKGRRNLLSAPGLLEYREGSLNPLPVSRNTYQKCLQLDSLRVQYAFPQTQRADTGLGAI
jgi:hypothetical protein